MICSKNNPIDYLNRALVVCAILICLYFCFVGRSNVHLFGDEFHSIAYLDKPYSELFTTFERLWSGVPLPLIQRLAVDVFGAGLFAYRFPVFLGAIATILIIYPAARMVGKVPAAIAALALSANSMHIFYSRFGRSYALMVFFAVLLVYAVNRAMNNNKPRAAWYVLTAISAGLLPWIHPTATAFPVGIGIAAALNMLIKKQSRRHWYWLVGSFTAGAVLCIALYLPVWKQMWQLTQNRYAQGELESLSVLDTAALMAGSRTAGFIWLLCVPIAVIWFLIKKRASAIILVVAVLVPAAAVAIARPTGQPYAITYAYARYVLTALPFMLMLLAWLLIELLRFLRLPDRLTNYIGLAAGVCLVVISYVAGPLGFRHTDDGPFANTYLSMMPLPAFDVPWNQTPPFYRQLADSNEPIKIIEAPELLSRSVLLYRNYYLQHRKDVMIGFVGQTAGVVPAGPYVAMWDTASIKNSRAEYLILHLNIDKEVKRYWQFVYETVWPGMKDAAVESLMVCQQTYFMKPHPPLHNLVMNLMESFGQPFYTDRTIIVWKLDSHPLLHREGGESQGECSRG